MAYKFIHVGIFPDDVSDHCAVAAIRNCKVPQSKPWIIRKRSFKKCDTHDIFLCDWKKLFLMPDVEIFFNFYWRL